MNIVSGLNLELPDGRRGHYIRVRVYERCKIKQKFFSVTKYGEKKALKLAKAWFDSKTN